MIGPKSAPEIGAYGIGFAADIDGVAHNLYIKRYLFEFEAEKKEAMFVQNANLLFQTHVLKYKHCLTSTHPIYHFLRGKALFTFHNILEYFLTQIEREAAQEWKLSF